jgi:adenylate cyclase
MKNLLQKITKLGPIQITFLTFLITVISIILYSKGFSFFNLTELTLYDLRLKWGHYLKLEFGTAKRPGNDIVILKIDEESMGKLGRWPWPRERLAELIDTLKEWGAKVIGFDVIFAEEESPIPDAKLVRAIGQSGSVILGYFFLTSEEELRGLKESNHPEETNQVFPRSLPVRFIPEKAKEFPMPEGLYIRSNISSISEEAMALGFMNVFPDPDGTIRWVPLVMRFRDKIYPSLALQVAREYLEDPEPFLKVTDLGVRELLLGETMIPTDKWGQFLVNYRGGRSTFPSYSVHRVISDKPEETGSPGGGDSRHGDR